MDQGVEELQMLQASFSKPTGVSEQTDVPKSAIKTRGIEKSDQNEPPKHVYF